MGSRYLTEMADWLRTAGITVVEYAGWQSRARSTGGYESGRPWGVMWHHTASQTSPQNDADYMCHGSSDRPIANLMVARDGTVWVLAAGATNTNGKGGPWKWSRGQVPKDNMNVYAVGMELCCNGVGEAYSQVQVDSAFTASIALVANLGLADTDICTHAAYAPDRKIDPATAAAVQGPWQPRSCTPSGTWDLDDLISEHCRRCQAPPTPRLEDNDVMHVIAYADDGTTVARGPAVIGPGYWHYSRTENEAYVWCKMWGEPRVLENAYDFDLLVKTLALEPDDGSVLGPT